MDVWNEIESPKVKVFQLGDEPIVMYVVKIREDEFMLIHEDAWDHSTGKVEFVNNKKLNELGIKY